MPVSAVPAIRIQPRNQSRAKIDHDHTRLRKVLRILLLSVEQLSHVFTALNVSKRCISCSEASCEISSRFDEPLPKEGFSVPHTCRRPRHPVGWWPRHHEVCGAAHPPTPNLRDHLDCHALRYGSSRRLVSTLSKKGPYPVGIRPSSCVCSLLMRDRLRVWGYRRDHIRKGNRGFLLESDKLLFERDLENFVHFFDKVKFHRCPNKLW